MGYTITMKVSGYLRKGAYTVKGELRACVPSIEDCMQAVDELLREGIAKEHILVITNFAGKQTILENHDLRGKDGQFFSAHRLPQQIKGLFHLKEYQNFKEQQLHYHGDLDPVHEYWQDIQDGDIAVLVLTEE